MDLYSNDVNNGVQLPAWIIYVGERWTSTGMFRAHDSSARKDCARGRVGLGSVSYSGSGTAMNNIQSSQNVHAWRKVS